MAPSLRNARPARTEVVVHLEVFEQRFFRIDRQRVDDAAVGRDRNATFGIWQWRAVEETRQALAPFAFDEQGSSSARCERQRERGRDGGFAGAALAGDDVQADAVPVAIAPACCARSRRSTSVVSVVGAG